MNSRDCRSHRQTVLNTTTNKLTLVIPVSCRSTSNDPLDCLCFHYQQRSVRCWWRTDSEEERDLRGSSLSHWHWHYSRWECHQCHKVPWRVCCSYWWTVCESSYQRCCCRRRWWQWGPTKHPDRISVDWMKDLNQRESVETLSSIKTKSFFYCARHWKLMKWLFLPETGARTMTKNELISIDWWVNEFIIYSTLLNRASSIDKDHNWNKSFTWRDDEEAVKYRKRENKNLDNVSEDNLFLALLSFAVHHDLHSGVEKMSCPKM